MNEAVESGSMEIPKDDRNFAMLTHLLSAFFWIFPGLIVWLMNKDKPNKAWVADQAKEVLNFQITMTLVYILSGFLALILIGVVIASIAYIVSFLLCIYGAIRTSAGSTYRYPFTLRLLH